MSQVTSPIILDSTGQQIHSDLQQIKSVLTTPSAAADITFDNTGTGMQADDVQDAITELKSNLTTLETEVSDKDSLVLIRELATWNIGANMSLEEYWDIYTEYYIYISHTATSDTFYQIILNKGFASHEFIVGYGTNSNSYAIMKYTSSNYYLNLVDARVGGSTYNPKIVVFGKK